MRQGKFLKCLSCGYLNPQGTNRCAVCEGENFIMVEYKNKKNNKLYLLLLVLMSFIISIVFLKDKTEIKSDLKFVSEKIPFNYHTYLNSLSLMKNIKKPDKDDINAVLNAFRYDDIKIKQQACYLLAIWSLKEYYKLYCSSKQKI